MNIVAVIGTIGGLGDDIAKTGTSNLIICIGIGTDHRIDPFGRQHPEQKDFTVGFDFLKSVVTVKRFEIAGIHHSPQGELIEV